MQALLQFVQSHATALASFGVAVLDLVFALNPNANAPDGLLHSVYVGIKKLMSIIGPKPQ
jgi:hypothetical protein